MAKTKSGKAGKRNPQDATLRNIRALKKLHATTHKRVIDLEQELDAAQDLIQDVSNLLVVITNGLAARVDELENRMRGSQLPSPGRVAEGEVVDPHNLGGERPNYRL